MDFLESYYNSYNEDGRLLSQHGQVEYITTQKYIHECLAGFRGGSILEIGAGTGRYSVALAKEGYAVTAVELIEHNIDILKSKLDGTENITVLQGNAVDLSFLEDNTFDMTLLLGPMYHLYTKEEKLLALSEAVRVTKPKGYILVAYCMNEPTIIQYVFARDNLKKYLITTCSPTTGTASASPRRYSSLSAPRKSRSLTVLFRWTESSLSHRTALLIIYGN